MGVMKMTGEIPEPEDLDDLRENAEQYQERMDELTPEGITLGSVLLPRDGASEFAVKAFHECMTEWGYDGIVYAQEGLHGYGDYFDEYFDDMDELKEDLERFKELSE